MQLAIPQAPRKVRFSQVPGAFARLARMLLVGLTLMAGLGFAGQAAGRFIFEEQAFLDRAVEVEGLLASRTLPPREQREDAEATLEVLYQVDKMSHSVSGVRTSAEYAEGLGHGAHVLLLVDPLAPDRPREARFARARALAVGLAPWGLGVGALLALGLFLWELRRTLRAELEPLRTGLLVWLTPDAPLPETRREVTFSATYWRQDVQHTVRARIRPGRAPVRNGEQKVLAALVPGRKDPARVIDADLARTLGWMR